jgi:hypothetical protein
MEIKYTQQAGPKIRRQNIKEKIPKRDTRNAHIRSGIFPFIWGVNISYATTIHAAKHRQ